MTLQEILDIAVVVCGTYAGMSCVCSWINERIASLLALRGWNLFRGIANLVETDDLAARVFNHPLIAANSPKPTWKVDDSKDTDTWSNTLSRFFSVMRSRPPSYVDAGTFSGALWQVLSNPPQAGSGAPAGGVAPAAGGAQTAQLVQTVADARERRSQQLVPPSRRSPRTRG